MDDVLYNTYIYIYIYIYKTQSVFNGRRNEESFVVMKDVKLLSKFGDMLLVFIETY